MPEGIKPPDFGGEEPPPKPETVEPKEGAATEALEGLLGAFGDIVEKNNTPEAQAAWEAFAVAFKDESLDNLDTDKIEEISAPQREAFKKLLDRRKEASQDPEKWNTLVKETVQFIESVGSEDVEEEVSPEGAEERIEITPEAHRDLVLLGYSQEQIDGFDNKQIRDLAVAIAGQKEGGSWGKYISSITEGMHELLGGLGYSEDVRKTMTPEDAFRVLDGQLAPMRDGSVPPRILSQEEVDALLRGSKGEGGSEESPPESKEKPPEQFTAESFDSAFDAWIRMRDAYENQGQESTQWKDAQTNFNHVIKIFFDTPEHQSGHLLNSRFSRHTGLNEHGVAAMEDFFKRRAEILELLKTEGGSSPEIDERWGVILGDVSVWFRNLDRELRPSPDEGESPEEPRNPLDEVNDHLGGREEDRARERAEQIREGFLELRRVFGYSERALGIHGKGSPEDAEEYGKLQRQVRDFFNGEPTTGDFEDLGIRVMRRHELATAEIEYRAIQRELDAAGETNPEIERRWQDFMDGMVYTLRMMDLDEAPPPAPTEPEDPPGPTPGEISPPNFGENPEDPPEDPEVRKERITQESKSAIRVLRESFRRSERARKAKGSGSRRDAAALRRFSRHVATFLSSEDLDFEQMGLTPEEVPEFEELCAAFRASQEDMTRFGPKTGEYANARRTQDEVLGECISFLRGVEKREEESGVLAAEGGSGEPQPPEGLPVREDPESAPASPEAGTSPEEREKLRRGFFYWGRMIQEYRGNMMGWILTKGFSEKGRMRKAFHRIGEHYQKEAAKAHKERMSPHSERKLSRTRDAGLLVGNALRYGSVFANVANMGNPFRLAMGVSMFAGRFGKAAKEVDLEDKDWLKKRRIGEENLVPILEGLKNAESREDFLETMSRQGVDSVMTNEIADRFESLSRDRNKEDIISYLEEETGLSRAMEEAHRLNIMIDASVNEDGMSVEEAHDFQYKRIIPEDIQIRFARAEKEGSVDSLVAKIAKAEYGKRASTLDRKIEAIERRQNRGDVSGTAAREQIQSLVTKHEAFIEELDAMVSDMGAINTSAYIMKNMERGSKAFAFGMTAAMGYTLLGNVAEAAENYEWDSSSGDGEADVSGGHEFEPTERQLRESGGAAFTPDEIRQLREMGVEEAGLAERLGHDVVAAESEEARLRAGLAAIDSEIEAHRAREGGPPEGDLLERARDLNDRLEAASGETVEARAAVRAVIETGELPPGTPGVESAVAEAAEVIAESHEAEEGPHAEAVFTIEKGDSPIAALKDIYKTHEGARTHLLESLDIEKLKAGDLDRIVTRKVVAEYLLEYGVEETSEHYDPAANKILEGAIDSWSEKNEGATFDPQNQKHLQELARQLSAKDFNFVLNDKVPNLIFEGDVIVLDSNGNYEVTASEGDEIRRGHIDTLEEKGLRDLVHTEAPGERVNVGTHRFGMVEAGSHFEMTHGIEPNPFEGFEWKTDVTEIGSYQYTNMNIVFKDQMEELGFTKALAYKPVGSRELEAVIFYQGNSAEGLEVYRQREGDTFIESKSQFYKRIVKVLEDPKVIEKWGESK